MEDKTLLNTALITAIASVIVLLVLSYYDKIPEKNFNDITSEDISSYVKVRGTVQQVYIHNKSTSIILKQECTLYVNMFDTDQNLSIGDRITVQGTVQEYKGKMQLQADKITR